VGGAPVQEGTRTGAANPDCRRAAMGHQARVDPMPPPTDEHRDLAACRQSHLASVDPALGEQMTPPCRHSHLAAVHLALADDVQAAPARRSMPRAVCALAAGVVLALAAPVAWISPAPRDQPAATVAGKAAGVEADDEDAGGPWPGA
jgi:hypothetical protein